MTTDLSKGPLFHERSRTLLHLEREIAVGGEGRIYVIAKEENLVAKLYHQPTAEHAVKLKAMLSHPPHTSMKMQKQIRVAWPLDCIVDAKKECVGFLMPRVDQTQNVPLFKLYNPKDRLKTAPNFTWRYLLRTAANLASVLTTLHAAGYVVGDLNESNVLVSTSALVTLVDCDSIQVPYGGGKTFRCPVGKLDYTPPELQEQNFAQVDRAPCHDNFALAILIFMLLMEGVHPFASSSPQDSDIVPLSQDNIRDGLWPFAPNAPFRPPPHILPFNTMHVELQQLMERCFIHGHHAPQQRPTAQEWHEALSKAQDHLAQCSHHKQHCYSDHLSICPWCERKGTLGFEAFPVPQQQFAFHAHSVAQSKKRASFTLVKPQHLLSRRSALLGLAGLAITAGGAIISLSTYSAHSPLPSPSVRSAHSPLPSPSVGKDLYRYDSPSSLIVSVMWSPSGNHIASVSVGGTVQVVMGKDGSIVYTNHQGARNTSIAWSPDDKYIASADWETISIWNAIDGHVVSTYQIFSRILAWSPDGAYIASTSESESVNVLRATDGKAIYTYQSRGTVDAIVWSPDSKRIASFAFGVQVWNATDGSLVYTFGDLIAVEELSWSPNGQYIASANFDGTVSVLDVANQTGIAYTYKGHGPNPVNCVTWSPNSQRIASGGWDKTVQIWNATDGTNVYTYHGHTSYVTSVSWSPDGIRIASADEDGSVRVWYAK